MIQVTSFARKKDKSNSNGGGSGGFITTSNTIEKKLDVHYLWGQPFNGTQDISGDINSNGKVSCNNIQAPNGKIKFLESESATIESLQSEQMISDNVDTLSLISDEAVITEIEGTNAEYTNFNGTNGNITNVTGTNATFDLATLLQLISTNITTENITVTNKATFFELIIDKVKSAGGSLIMTPSDGFKVEKVVSVGGDKKLYWKATDGETSISNMWKVNDQAICQTFNAASGVSYNVSNKYYWALVKAVGTETIDGTDYHYITLDANNYVGVLDCEVGDEISQLGYRGNDDESRQAAIYIASYNSIDTGITAPLIAQYRGINDFNLASHRKTWFAANSNEVTGNLKISTANGDINVNDAILNVTNQQITAAANQILVDVQSLLVNGNITVNGLITNTSNHINQYNLSSSNAVVIDLVNNKNVTIERIESNETVSLDNGQIVYLPFYDSMYDVGTKIVHTNPSVTASQFGFNGDGLRIWDNGIDFTVPKYDVEGTQVRITNSFVSSLNNWQNYEYIYLHGQQDLLYEQLIKSCVLLVADARLMSYKNFEGYWDNSKSGLIFNTPYGTETSTSSTIEPSHSGAFLYNGLRSRFLLLLPSQSVNLRSQIIQYQNGRKVLNWLVENANEFVPIKSAIGIEYGNEQFRWDYNEKINGTSWKTQYTQVNDVILGNGAINANSINQGSAVYPIIHITNNTLSSNGVVPYIDYYETL